MKKSITILTFLTMIGFVGILPGALPAAGPSDAFSAGVSKPLFPPVITEGDSVSVTMDEDGSPTPFTLTLHATDADGDSLTWSIYSGATYGNPAVTTGTGTSQDITYAPAPNFSGSDSFVVRVVDGVDGGDTITVNVTVRPRNDAPVNTAMPMVTGILHVGHMLTGTTGTWNDSADTTPGSLTYAYQWQRADDASGGNTVDIAGATGTTHSIVNDDNQKYLRFRVTATDNGEGLPASASTTVSTEWQPIGNVSPDITEGAMAHVTLDEDSSPTAFALTLNATDADSDTLTWSIQTAALHGTATASGTGTSKVISYTPAQDYNTAAGGSESFVVQVDDGLGGTDTITVDVTVNARNDGPVNTVPGAQATAEDTAVVFSSGTGNPISVTDLDVADTPGGTLQLTLSAEHGTLTLATVAGLTFATGDGVSDPIMTFYGTPANLINALNGLAYAPAANYHGADTLTVATNDRGYTGAGGALTDTDTVPITVTGVNDAPAVGGVTAAGVVDADNGETAYDFTVTFTDDSAIDVATLDNSDVYVRTPGATTIAATFVSVDTPGNGTPRTATYRIVPPGGSWDVADNGTYTIGIYGSQVGDDEAVTVPASANIGTFTVALETTAPTVLDVTSSTANGSYRAGQSILIRVTFSEPVIVTGNPRLTLETGASDGIAAYMSGSGTSVLTFLYTVLSPHVSADLDYAGTTALALNGGTIKDAVGNDAALTLPVPGAAGSLSANKDIVIDTTAPSAPNAPDLQASSDTGTSNTDNVTDVTTPSFDIAGVETGATVTLTSQVVGGGGPIVVQAVAGGSTCTITMTSPLSPGIYVITATQTDLAGNVSLASAAMAPNLYIAIAPSVTTEAVTDAASAAATGHGTIVALGSPSPTAHGLVWNTSGMPTLADFSTNEGAATSTGAFTSTLTGLSPNTLYYVRSYATNNLTTVYGDQLTFTSLQAFTLTYTAGAGGTITGTSPQTVDYGGSGATVTAVPNTNYHFVSWSDGVMTAARTDANVTADVNVTATFASDVSPERTALIALYTATGGDSWTVRTGWKDGDLYEDGFAMPGTESTWFGVVMTGAAITAISLPANNLVGSIPSELGGLSSLTILDLRSNSLTGSIPASLGDLTNLTLLRLSYNQLTGTLPAELWNLVNLQTLDLCSNQLSGTLPAAIGNLTALRELLLYTNSFSGSLPSEMGSLVNLRSLALHENDFSGALPASMGGLTALQELLLHENAFTGAFPEEWGGLSALTFLRIDHNELSGSIPATFGNLSNLTALIAGNNGLSGAIPPELANLHQLVTLDFRFNSLTGTIPAFLGGMTSLQVLYLQHNTGLIGSIPPELGNLTSLRELLLHGDALTGGIPVELGNLANLQMLYLNSNQLTGAIPPVLGNLHNLTNLHLQSNQLSGSIPPELGGLTNLIDLCLSDNPLEGTIPAALGNLTQLQILSIYGNKLVGPIPSSLANLTALVPASTDLGYNMLFASDETLVTFLNAKDPDWAATQTVPPTEVTATSLDNAVILVSWLPITYTGGGGHYDVLISETAGGPYALAGQTSDKLTSSVQVTGLTPGTRYYFVVQTHTDAHSANRNLLESEYSAEASAFAWTQVSVQISGNITAGGLPLAGVVMSGLPNGTVTDTSGNYSGTVSAGSNITVIPMMDGYTFSPASRSYPGITENQTGQDYAATEGTTHTLTYTAGANGTITGISPQTVAHGGSGTTVTAVPNTGYHFVSWSDGILTAARTDTNVTADITVTASFAIDTFTLTYTAGTGGTITGTSPQTVNYGGSGAAVTAVPEATYHFVNWSDGSTANPRTDTNVTANVTVTANFAIDTFTLTYTAGTGGTITGTTPQTVAHGSSGTLVTAVPDTGYHFVSWSDGVLTAARTDTNVTTDINVTASFAITSYTLTYTAGANGSITGTSPQTVAHGGSGTTVTAVPNTGYHFVSWSDGVLTAARTDANVTADINVTATFAITSYTLAYTAGANGTITGTSPQTVAHGSSGTEVTAVPNTGYHFVSWSDGVLTAARTDANVTADINVTATFAITSYTLTYTAGANGTITGTSPQTVAHGSSGTEVTAVPNTGYHFVSWSDGVLTAARTDSNVTADITVTATFAITSYTLTYTAGANGTISGISPQTVAHGSSGTEVTAVPNTGYHFVSWSDGVLTAARTDTNVTADITVTASFAITTYTLTYTAGANGTISGISPQTVDYGGSGTLVTAVADTNYHFVNWSDGVLTAARTDTNVTANVTVTANFAIDTFTLTYTAGENGTISGISPQTVAHGASGTLVTAVPNTGYHFVSWSDGVLTAARTDTNVLANLSVTATFAIDMFTISGTVTAGGTGLAGVTMAGLPGSPVTDASGAYSAQVTYGSTVTVTPTHSYYTFDPASNTYTDVTADAADQNYDASLIATSQRQALIALYSSTNGDSWTIKSGWKTEPLYPDGFSMPGTEGAWYGITIDGGTQQVTSISLPGNNLTGTIPAQLGNLVNLTTLNLENNHLSGPIPAELGNLTDLETFRLWYNQLSGPIPAALGNLTSLTGLDLGQNQLTGSIPPELGNLTSLTTLNLSANQLTGTIPPELGNLTNLGYLYLSSNNLSGSIPAELGNLTNLQVWYLSVNQVTGPIPPELGNLTNLRWLYLGANQLTGSIPPELGSLTSLTALHLGGNQLTGSIPLELGNLVNLQTLGLYGNDLSGSIPATLANLTRLTSLELGYNALYTSDETLIAFLNSKDRDWSQTQTIAPASVTATSLDNAVIMVSWLPVTYTADAGLSNVYMSTTAGGPYTLAGSTADKATTSLNVTGLTPAQRYYFVVRTQTNAHAGNANIVESGDSNEASAVAWTQINVQITGTVTLSGGAPLAGVVMNGLTGSPVTNALGVYAGTEAAGWSGTVTPTLAGHAFAPGSISYTDVTANQTAQDYTAAILTYTISGTVTIGGSGLMGVTMAGLPGSPVTDASGAYSAQVTYGSTVTVTPTHSYYTFDPASNTYTDVTADAADQNYDASLIATSQRQALIALYSSTNGDSWTIKSGWKTEPLYPDGFSMPGTEGAWYGITIDGGTQQVTSISLPGNNLTGTIPAQLGNLVNLTTLELGSNQLSGSIPVELGNMTSLQYLGLSHNQLTGSIPGGLGNLTNLTNLNLRYNQLSGPIPAALGNLANLRLLYLTSNQLTGSIPPELGNLTSLTTLLLDENQLTGSIPVDLGSLTSLTTLRLNVNQLSGPIPVELGNLVNLIALELGDNDLNGTIPAALGNLTNLISLGLGNNRLEGTIPAGLGSLTTLDTLVLKGNLLSGPIPVSLTGLTYLARPYTDFGYNALYTSDAALSTFLDSRDPDWAQTQTIAPTSVTATSLDNAVIMVSWLPVTYTADAGLSNVYMSTTAGGPYTLAGSTADKATTSLNVTGLTPAQRYYFVVRTQTNAHGNNTNIVESGDSNEASAVAWTQISVQITGTVTLSGGAPLAGVVMNGLTGSPVTNALGVYAGTEAAGWSGTVTPTLAGRTFAPASISYTDVTANQTAQDYTATVLTYTISGTVTAGGSGLAGVTMAGLPGSPVTDASGYYSAPVDYGWGGTVTPTFAGYSFAPSSRVYSNVAENHLADTYEATLLTYTISGTVTVDSAPLPGVVMSGLTGNPVTDASGNYAALVSHGWSGTVTPTLEGYTFDPVSRTYTTVTADQTAQGYTATAVVPTITVTSPNGGETWATGSAHAITWTQTNLTGTVTIDLYKGGVYQKTLGTAEATAQTFDWMIASTETAGTDYMLRVWQSGAASDDSDANFSITAAVRKDDLLGTWDDQGVYYRDSDTGAWVSLASPATMITSGDIDDDGTDDLIGIWPSQGGVWVKYSSTGEWANLATTAVHITTGDMNGDGRVDLLGTWDGQGVYYRDSATGGWVEMATPASMITCGDLDNDGTDDLIGIWAGQGGVWVKYSSTGGWEYIGSTPTYIEAGDMNGDGRDELLGTWEGQGVYYRNSETGAWTQMASEATMITAGDLEGDGTDDLIGLWPTQGGIWVKYSSSGAWELLSSTAQYIAAGKMRPASGAPEIAVVTALSLPIGGAEPGPESGLRKTDESSKGPGGARFVYLTEPNLIPNEKDSTRLRRVPGPGEPRFMPEKQANLFPAVKDKARDSDGAGEKPAKKVG